MADRGEPVDELADVGALRRDLVLGLGVHVDRHQEVAAAHLDAVTRVEDEPHRRRGRAHRELAESLDELAQPGVLAQRDVEAQHLEALGDRARIADGILQGAGAVGAVADDQRDLAFRRLGSRAARLRARGAHGGQRRQRADASDGQCAER